MEEKKYLNECAPFAPILTVDTADVLIVIVNPFQISKFLIEKSDWIDANMPGVRNFIEKDFQLNSFPMNLIGNYTPVFSNGKVLCFLWVASVEDKALCLMKVDQFFRQNYKFYDMLKETEIFRTDKSDINKP